MGEPPSRDAGTPASSATPHHTGGDDPSSVANLFAQRLSEALANQPLPLARVRERLARSGLSVSIATLSYWASGRTRPARGRSLAVVTALESVLGVPAGWFTSALDAEHAPADIARIALLDDEAAAELTTRGLTARTLWERVMTHYTVHVDADGCERLCETAQVSRAEADGTRSWTTFVFDEGGSTPRFEALQGVEIREDSAVQAAGAHAVELILPEPARKGESVFTRHRAHFVGRRESTRHVGYVVNRTTGLLILEVVFEGEAPSTVRRWFRDPDSEQATAIGAPIPVRDGRATCVIIAAAPGQHAIKW